MSYIFDTNTFNENNFDFTKIYLSTPIVNLGNNYFIKLIINQMPLYIHTPECLTKQSLLKNGKNCDLIFKNTNINFINWIENLEIHCQKTIYENKEKWFETDLELYDIENSMTSPLKTVKSDKILRASIPSILGKCSISIFDEYGNEEVLEKIKENTNLKTIIEVKGIKCSARNFSFDIEIKQIMILNNRNLFDKCIIEPQSLQIKDKFESSINLDSVTFSDSIRKSSSVLNSDSVINSELLINSDSYKPVLESDSIINSELVIKSDSYDPAVTKIDVTKTDSIINTEHAVTKNDVTKTYSIINTEPAVIKSETETELIIKSESEIKSEPEIKSEWRFDTVDINYFNLEENGQSLILKERSKIYYELYSNAKQKFKEAKDLAFKSFLEENKIKNLT
jgi:hypothetical protein